MEPDTFCYTVSVPAGTYATLYLPVFDKNAKTVSINSVVSPVSDFEIKDGKLVIDLAPGKYSFEVMR